MKNVLTIFTLLIAAISFGQSNSLSGDVKIADNDTRIESVSIHVQVDSAEEIASTFKAEDIESIFEEVEDGEEISFKITCNGKTMSNGVKPHVSYEINGYANDKKGFVKSVKKLRKAAINYYKNKE